MSAAIIAKALNSTLGTSEFKSLDEIFLAPKNLVASSELFYFSGKIKETSFEKTGYVDGHVIELQKDLIKFNVSGSVRVIMNVKTSGSRFIRDAFFRLYLGQEKIMEFSKLEQGGGVAETHTYETLLKIKKGDILKIHARYLDGSIQVAEPDFGGFNDSSIVINASPIDLSPISVLGEV
jgi:hypothetical protein